MCQSHSLKRLIYASLILVAAIMTVPAMSQTPPDGSTSELMLEEIIVTAQKREQSLTDVPLSVAVVTGETLQNFKVYTFDELDRWVPNFWVNDSPGNNTVYIRGIGTTPGNLAFEQSVTLFVDGVYAGRARQFMSPFLDIERVEVLRGPQGALFGTNTSAGAVSVTTARPTEEFMGRASLGYEFEYESYEVTGYVSGPMSDNVQGRLALRYEDIGGFLTNTVTGAEEPESENFVIRGSLAWQPGDNWDIVGKIESSSFDTEGSAFQRLRPPEEIFDQEKETAGFGQIDDDKNDAFNATLTANYFWGENTLTSITAYSEYDFTKHIHADQGPTDTWFTTFAEDFSQFSQELRLISPAGETLEYIVGLYYHTNDVDPLFAGSQVIFPTTVGPLAGVHEVYFYQDTDLFSAFGALTWNINDQWRVTGELRYTNEDKSARQDRAIVSGILPPTWGDQTITDSRSDSSTDPGFKIQWYATESTMLYATFAQGSKSGGWQGNSRDLTADNWQIDGESSENFEVGLKSTFLGGSAWLSLTLYNTEYDDLQVSVWTGTTFATANAAKATSKGFELDGAWQFAPAWSLQGGLAYLDATYDDFPGAPCRIDEPDCDPADNNLAGVSLGWAPEWSGNIALNLDQDMKSDLRLVGTLALLYRDDVWLTPTGDAGPANTLQPSTTWLDARIGIGSQDGRWTVALVGKNLTDEVTIAQSFVFPFPVNIPDAGSINQVLMERPRTYGIEAIFQW
jgi:iron complex outermembrane receptor protein